MHADDKRDGQLASVKNDYLTRGLIALGSAPLQSQSFLRRLRAETNAFNPIESVKPSRHVDGDLELRRRQEPGKVVAPARATRSRRSCHVSSFESERPESYGEHD